MRWFRRKHKPTPELSHKLVSEIECLDHDFRHEVALAAMREHIRTFPNGTIEQQIDACPTCHRWQNDPRVPGSVLYFGGIELEDDERYCANCMRIFKVEECWMESALMAYEDSFYGARSDRGKA